MRLLRLILIVAPGVAFLASAGWFLARELEPTPTASPHGRLVVVVVFDQMRGDYLERWAPVFEPGGFETLKTEGVWFSDAHLPYATTMTGPGHASIATGVPPSVHGIIDNEWFDRASGKKVYCGAADRPYDRIPPHPFHRGTDSQSMAPVRILVPTVADRLRQATNGAGRVVSLAVKDRTAVLLGGQEPTACYRFDNSCGEFHTNTFYRDRPHSWLERFNDSRLADRWFGQNWDRLLDAESANRFTGPDDGPGEGIGINSQGRTFPHPLSLKLDRPDERFYATLENSPFANELVWELAKAAITGERLGRGESADLIYLGFSANDSIGHTWGPDSHEVLDVTMRSNRLITAIREFLQEKVGPDRFAIIITSDHGIAPLPERASRNHPGAGRFELGTEFGALPTVLDQTFGKADEPWIDRIAYPNWHLNRRVATEKGIPFDELESFAAQWLGNRPAMSRAFTRTQLTGPSLADPLGRQVQFSFHPDRSGDVVVVPRPYLYPGNPTATGTTHGSPYPYDTHVPILAAGVGVPRLGKRPEPVNALLVAALTCRALGIEPPPGIEPLPIKFE